MTKLAKRLTAALTTAAVLITSLVITGTAEELPESISSSFTFENVPCDAYGTNYVTAQQNTNYVELSTWAKRRYSTASISLYEVLVSWHMDEYWTGDDLNDGHIQKNTTNRVSYTDSYAAGVEVTTTGGHRIKSVNAATVVLTGHTVSYI